MPQILPCPARLIQFTYSHRVKVSLIFQDDTQEDPPSQLQPHQPRHLPHHLPYSPPPTATSMSFPCTTESEGTFPNITSEGQPPVTYMASLIANQLLQVGASMFGRQTDANCVLKVGNDRYFVHVQMLAVSTCMGSPLVPFRFVFVCLHFLFLIRSLH